MALSETPIPETGQHFVECGSENCTKNCQFYCNPCHRPLCKECKDVHQKRPDNKNHDVVSYRQRKLQLPVEKCKDHPIKDLDILCHECNVPLCSKCTTLQEHRGHTFVDLETIYTANCSDCQGSIIRIHQYFLPTSVELQKETREDATEIRTIMEDLKASIKADAESLKELVDVVASEKVDHINKIEESLKKNLQERDKTYDDYISYLNKLVNTFHKYLSSTEFKNNPMIFPISESLKIQPIPETTKPVLPVFTAGQYSKEDVVKLLGSVNVPNTTPKYIKINPVETIHEQSKPKEIQVEGKTGKSYMKQTLSLSSSIAKVREFNVPNIDKAYHMSFDKKSGRFWVSHYNGDLVHIDLQGNQLWTMKFSYGFGCHTVTLDGNLIYSDKNKNVINTISLGYEITEFIKTGEWKPISVCSSHINGDILVGITKKSKAKVTRYNKSGQEIRNIQRDNKGQELYCDPHYITENINGDICTSDFKKRAVVVVNRSGQHRFSYRRQESTFCPYGICTDVLGHIIVCDVESETVHLLNKDGEFISHIFTLQQGVKYPRSVCLDDANNLCLGQHDSNIVAVYKYLQ